MSARKRPCAECPWRRDTLPGQFDRERYVALRHTTGEPGAEAPIGSPMFACHKSAEGKEIACAGWLVAVGYDLSLTVRLLTAMRHLPVIEPDESWPELYASYREMEEAMAGG
jgi:hypothetical protein